MSNARYTFDIHHIRIGISQCFQENRLRIILYGPFQLFFIKGIHEGSGHAEIRKSMGQEIISPSIYVFGSHNMLTLLRQILEGIGDGRRPRCNGKRRAASLQRRHSALKYVLCGIGQPSVNITAGRKGKSAGRILTIMEYI